MFVQSCWFHRASKTCTSQTHPGPITSLSSPAVDARSRNTPILTRRRTLLTSRRCYQPSAPCQPSLPSSSRSPCRACCTRQTRTPHSPHPALVSGHRRRRISFCAAPPFPLGSAKNAAGIRQHGADSARAARAARAARRWRRTTQPESTSPTSSGTGSWPS